MVTKLEPIVLCKEFTFEAAHRLPKHTGKCRFLHGHSWKLKVYVEGLVHYDTGFVVDYADLKKLVNEQIINVVDHAYLGANTLKTSLGNIAGVPVFGEDFYPTSENLVKVFVRLLLPLVPELGLPSQRIKLAGVDLHETCTSAAIWRP